MKKLLIILSTIMMLCVLFNGCRRIVKPGYDGRLPFYNGEFDIYRIDGKDPMHVE